MYDGAFAVRSHISAARKEKKTETSGMETQRKSTYYSAAAFLEREKGRVGERE